MFSDKKILVTGSCGTVGSELVYQLLKDPMYSPEEVIGIDNNESQLFLQEQEYIDDKRVHFYVADIRDRDELIKYTKDIDIIFHAAALKHVTLCERSPEQTIFTNILGLQNVIAAANYCGVERVIFTSSDKAVNPTNVMGTSKLMGERLMTAANSHARGEGPVFSSTRFGNVLGSNGSVVPVFHDQIANGKSVTLTDPEMTRFVMTIKQAVKLVIDSACMAKGGEVFVTKMPVMRIEDIAKAMIEELAPVYGRQPEDIRIDIIGTKPGEKLYEELMNIEETRRGVELKNYFSILPAFRGIYREIEYSYSDMVSSTIDIPYISSKEKCMSIEEIKIFFKENGLFISPEYTYNSQIHFGGKRIR